MKQMKAFFQKETTIAALLVLLTALLSYLPNLSGFGFYQDDWYLLWSARARGPESIIALFTIDRPYMGWVNYFDYLLLGDNLALWRGYALFWRLANSLGVLWLLRLIWPEKKFTTTAAALLVTIYPAYLTQPIVLNFKNYIMEYTLAVYSMIWMVYALRAKGRGKKFLWTVLALAFSLFYVLIYEFMIGLEATRLMLLAVLLWQQEEWRFRFKAFAGRLLRVYLPYAVVSLSFVYWRFFVFESSRPAVSEAAVLGRFVNSPWLSVRNTLIEIGKDLLETVLLAWAVPFYRFAVSAPYGELGAALLAAAAAGLLLLGYALWLKPRRESQEDTGAWLLMGIGALSLLASLFTIVVPGRNVLLAHDFGRYALHATLGIGLLVAAFLSILPGKARWTLLLILVCLSTATQYLNGAVWRGQWEELQATWWEIAWRVPQFESGTLILLSGTYGPQQDYEVWGPANLIYYPDEEFPPIDAEVMYSGSVDLLMRGDGSSDHLRDIALSKDFSRALIFSRSRSVSCLHAVDGSFPYLPGGEDTDVRLAVEFSRPEQIVVDAPAHSLPEAIFGPEPEHGWCYYYQRAALARQQGDWAEVVRLGIEANDRGLSAADPSEWMPFLEANVIEGRGNQAKWMSKIIKSDRMLSFSICRSLENGPPDLPGYDAESIYVLLCE